MANLQVKNVPEDLNERLHRYAKQQRRSIRDVVLEAVLREASILAPLLTADGPLSRAPRLGIVVQNLRSP